MRRRDFITLVGGAAAAWPFAGRAQQTGRARRIGWLGAAKDHPYQLAAIAVFRRRLAELGWVEGRNL
jgi:putative ABC transport system substrate-binding protein